MHLVRGLALAATCSLTVAALTIAPNGPTSASPAGAPGDPAAPARSGVSDVSGPLFDRVATYPVFQNVPAGVDPDEPTVAEISTVTADGRTVVYTDALGKRIGFLDITDPSKPVGRGTLDLAELGHPDDQPTSVAAVGDYVLVVIDESGGDFTHPAGRVDVVRLSDRKVVRSIDLGGQPDSIAVSPDGGYAAIAMENQRDEGFTPPGAGEGELPQLPAGSLQVLTLGPDPAAWTAADVPLVEADGDPLPALAAAGLYAPQDPEPEYVDINDDNQVVLTLQENNGVVVIDLPTRRLVTAFSAGQARVSNIDTTKDGLFNPHGSIEKPREPDAVQWVGDGLVATANEGDLFGGSRGWSVFDTATGKVVWDSGNTFEEIAVAHGLFNNDRAEKKGPEPEGLAFEVLDGVPTAFVGSERSNFVAVYDLTDPTAPVFRQALPATNGPEGLLPIPSRDLLVVSSEVDDAAAQVRASVGVYQLGTGRPAFPSVVSANPVGAPQPIGWGALGALSGVPGDPTRMYAASDAAYATGRIYSLDVSQTPAVITRALTVREPDGTAPALDIEGLATRSAVDGGGFWLAVEGATGGGNALVRTDAAGVIRQRVPLPADVAAHVRNWGLEGVTVSGTGRSEQLVVALQRPLWVDPTVSAGDVVPQEGDVARIGRYDVAAGTWTWFGYPLSSTATPGDWIGLSEVTMVDADTVAVVERDKLAGTRARIKRIYTVDLPAGAPGRLTPVSKRLALDLLPAMAARRGWTQEKLEGLGISSGGQVFAVTDNDGLKDATGETQLFHLGALKSVFASSLATRTSLAVSKRKVRAGKPVKVQVAVRPSSSVSGAVRLLDGDRQLRSLALRDGVAKVWLRLKPGRHELRATYAGDDDSLGSTSRMVVVRVVKAKRGR
ncbi:esterase-like activity of phytase family protein [Nocardioides sp. GXZ039]|uniref:esterase-like activity of phytase family protein n=1 Tax=Nocardioides sp. GXZ039 TaxID=3136018 RepID=UPI0030F3B067